MDLINIILMAETDKPCVYEFRENQKEARETIITLNSKDQREKKNIHNLFR